MFKRIELKLIISIGFIIREDLFNNRFIKVLYTKLRI